ncbi:MAG: sensor histidine kinase, partial [Firmicutes bacterium]|nr:sensor histidine kinase [Bacillota bacterium]
GIGLSLAQSIVEQHGGELIVRSSAKGSEFTMRFYPEMSKEERLV